MGLLILKNQGYQEYQDSLAQKESKGAESAAAESAPVIKTGKEQSRRVNKHRHLGLLAVFTVITVLSSATTIVLYQYRSGTVAAPPKMIDASTQEAPIAAETLWAEQQSLWRCSDGSYTNVPTAGGDCEYVGAAEGTQGDGPRFITPGGPRS